MELLREAILRTDSVHLKSSKCIWFNGNKKFGTLEFFQVMTYSPPNGIMSSLMLHFTQFPGHKDVGSF